MGAREDLRGLCGFLVCSVCADGGMCQDPLLYVCVRRVWGCVDTGWLLFGVVPEPSHRF